MTDSHQYFSMIGRFLMLDSPDGEGYTVSRFAERLDDMMYLMAPHSPHDGRPIEGGQYIVHLGMLALTPDHDPVFPRAQIFPDWEALARLVNTIDEMPEERVIKLVRPEKGEG